MATKQGMCKNCGSLVMFDDRDELCECVFCNCVFPSAEAAEILANPDGYEFKNETFEKQEGSKHYYSNPVMPDLIEKAVKRDEVSKAKAESAKLKPNEFEISPNDVKAPKKLLIQWGIGTAVAVALIVGIALPLYLNRKALKEQISADVNTIYATSSTVDYSTFGYKQINIYGITCQHVKIALSEGIEEGDAQALYANYKQLRSSKRGNDSGDVEMYIYTPDTIYFISGEKGLIKDVQEPVEIIETTETSK